MQKPPLQQLIDTKFDKLPMEVSSLFHSEENATIISSIAQNNKLSEEQEMSLFDEVAYVFFNTTPISNFKNEIKNSLSIDEKTALSISSEIYGRVFLPIKRFLIETPDDAMGEKNNVSTIKNTAGSDTETINHQDILNEIENPTPSIYPSVNNNTAVNNSTASDSNVLDIDNLELEEGGNGGNSVNGGNSTIKNPGTVPPIATNSTTKTSTNNTVEASVPVLSGFKPIINDAHPAQPTADKLNSALDGTTKTPVREVYQSKKPDPYHEPLE